MIKLQFLMKYDFINSKFISKKENIKNFKLSDELDQKIKNNNRRVMSFAAIIFGFFLYFCQILKNILEYRPDTFFYIYITITCTAVYFIIGLLFAFFWKNDKYYSFFKWVTFMVIYLNQVSWILFLITHAKDEVREVRNLFILYVITGFYLVIFFRFNYIFVYVICGLNLGLTIFFEVYNRNYYNKYYILELFLCIITPAVCIISRKEHDYIMSLIMSQMISNKNYINYIDTLLYQLPYFYFTFYKDEIVYTNNRFEKFLEFKYEENSNNLVNIGSDIKNRQNLITNEDKLLFVNHLNYKDDCRKIENIVSQNFLFESKFTFLEEDLKRLVTLCEINLRDDSHTLLQVVKSLQKILENSDENFQIEPGKFYHLGITKYSPKNNEEFFHQIYVRWIKHSEYYWLEFIMSDVSVAQKIKNLEEYYKIRETFLSKLAHEFKTPLLGIIGLSEELEKEISDKLNCDPKLKKECIKIHAKISNIYDMSNYVLYLINDVVNYLAAKKHSSRETNSSIKEDEEEHSIVIKKENFNLKETIDFCFRIMKTLLSCNKEKIKYIEPQFDSEIASNFVINTDQIRLKQILLNLISNSVKFTKSGFILIQVWIDKVITENENESDILKISVQDTGTGIHPHDIQYLFKKEKMFTNNVTSNRMGSGLGLSISHHIANLLGGDLKVQSEYGKGSKFILTLPIEKKNILSDMVTINQNLNQENSIIRSNLVKEKNSSSTVVKDKIEFVLPEIKNLHYKNRHKRSSLSENEKKILIVDDNDLIIKSIEKLFTNILNKFNITNIEIIKGSDGIDLIKEIIEDQKLNNRIVCSFVDENMEYLNGGEAIKIIRILESKKKIKKSLICKISSINESIEYLSEYVPDFYIEKPLKSDDVEQLLKKLYII